MNTKRNVILVTAIAAVFLVAAVGSASADEEITSLPFTTNEDDERYFLTGDLTCADTSTAGITIANNNVIIDGQTHKITGTVSGTDCAQWTTSQTYPARHCGIVNFADKDNVVIKNLEIENFCTGIALGQRPGSGGSIDNNTVTGCKIHNCGKSTVVTHGIQMVWTNNCNINKNEIYEIDGTGIDGGCSGGGNGIFLFGDIGPERGWYNSITCNNLHHNVKSGFFTKHQCMHNTISYNHATYNTQSGIMPKCERSNYNEFEYNDMSYNGVNGFYLGGDNNIIRYNTMINNDAEGLGLKGTADSNTITNNTACGNGGTGDMAWTDVTNVGDSNTCDSGPAGACDWNCDSLTQVYYDVDGDGDCCSDDPADWTCGNTLGVGSCNNPGKFNSNAWSDHCYLECNTTGNDPNDCDASTKGDPPVAPVPELATIVLFGAGLITLVGYVELRKRRKG